MKLILEKPLCFIDLETTGVNVGSDRIIEISILKIKSDYSRDIFTYRINPGIPIPEFSSAIHGIYDKDVADKPKFEELAPELVEVIGNSDLAGYNSNKFDFPLLVEEFLRCNVEFDLNNRRMIDVQAIFHKMEQRTLAAAYKFYCNRDLENAHSAEADTIATFEVFAAQLNKYETLKADIDFLHQFSQPAYSPIDFAGRIVRNEKNIPVFNFGKHKGKPVEEVFRNEPSYYAWMMQGDFPLYTKKVITSIKEQMTK